MDHKIAEQMCWEFIDEEDRRAAYEEMKPWNCPECGKQHPFYHKECWWCHPTGYKNQNH